MLHLNCGGTCTEPYAHKGVLEVYCIGGPYMKELSDKLERDRLVNCARSQYGVSYNSMYLVYYFLYTYYVYIL